MEIVNIEAHTFETMLSRFEAFTQKVDALCRKSENKQLKEWLDNQDVCMLLNISKRTLQSFRDNGTLTYTMIGHKAYYRPEDVARALCIVSKRKEVKHG